MLKRLGIKYTEQWSEDISEKLYCKRNKRKSGFSTVKIDLGFTTFVDMKLI